MCRAIQNYRQKRNAFEMQAIEDLKKPSVSNRELAKVLICISEQQTANSEHLLELERTVNAQSDSLWTTEVLNEHIRRIQEAACASRRCGFWEGARSFAENHKLIVYGLTIALAGGAIYLCSLVGVDLVSLMLRKGE